MRLPRGTQRGALIKSDYYDLRHIARSSSLVFIPVRGRGGFWPPRFMQAQTAASSILKAASSIGVPRVKQRRFQYARYYRRSSPNGLTAGLGRALSRAFIRRCGTRHGLQKPLAIHVERSVTVTMPG